MNEPSESTPIHLPVIVRPAGPPVVTRAHVSRPADGESGQQPALSVAFLLRALQQWWKIAVPAGVLLAAAGAVIVMATFKPQYQATAWLLITDPTGLIVRDGGSDHSPRFVKTQVELITSPVILTPVLGHEKVARSEEILSHQDDAVAWLARNVKVNAKGGSDLYQVEYSSNRPENAQAIVNAIVDVYLKHHQDKSESHKKNTIKLLGDAELNRKLVVEGLKQRVKRLTATIHGQNPTSDAPIDVANAIAPVTALRQRLIGVEVDREVLRAQIGSVEQSKSGVPQAKAMTEMVIETQIDALPDIKAAMEKIGGMREQLAEIERRHQQGKNSSYYQEWNAAVRRAEAMLANRRQEHREKQMKQPTGPVAAPETEFARLKSRLIGLDAEYGLLKKRLDEHVRELSKRGGDSAQLDFDKGELAREENIFGQVATRRLLLETELLAPSGVYPQMEAALPKAPIDAWPYKPLLLACLAAFCAPFMLVIVWERLTRRIGDSEQLSCESALAIVGEIAQLPTRPIVSGGQSARRRVRRDLGLFQESIDSLRTCLLLSDQTHAMRVFSVTSAVSGEGKTSLASQLAVSIARSTGKNVLLIDSDMRSPDIHSIFQTRMEPGLAELLAGDCRIEDAIQTDIAGGVHIIPAGQLVTNPHKLVGRGDFDRLLDDVRQRYEYTVIDTPPILCASESLVISRAADGTLLCALRDVSRSRQVRMASDRLTTAGARVIGAVLSGTPFGRYASLYGQYAYEDRDAS